MYYVFLTLRRNLVYVEEKKQKMEMHGQKEGKKEEQKWTDRTKKEKKTESRN